MAGPAKRTREAASAARTGIEGSLRRRLARSSDSPVHMIVPSTARRTSSLGSSAMPSSTAASGVGSAPMARTRRGTEGGRLRADQLAQQRPRWPGCPLPCSTRTAGMRSSGTSTPIIQSRNGQGSSRWMSASVDSTRRCTSIGPAPSRRASATPTIAAPCGPRAPRAHAARPRSSDRRRRARALAVRSRRRRDLEARSRPAGERPRPDRRRARRRGRRRCDRPGGARGRAPRSDVMPPSRLVRSRPSYCATKPRMSAGIG